MNPTNIILTVTFLGAIFLISLLFGLKVLVSCEKNMRESQNTKIKSVQEIFHKSRELNKDDLRANACYEPKMFKPMTIKQNRTSGYNFRAATMKMNDKKIKMDDVRLVSLIRNYWIYNPSPLQYKFYDNKIDYSSGQSSLVDSLLENKERGFYIECGAFDGELQSTSLLFERYRKWQGLLIEPDPISYSRLKYKHRMAFTINACISPYPYPVMMKLERRGLYSRIMWNTSSDGSDYNDVQCFPLYSILLALKLQAVDFLSIDVGGLELGVLKTMPLKSTNINIISVSCDYCSEKNETDMEKFLQDHGYSFVSKLENFKMLSKDLIFQRR
ncbi:uncharacterized protein LOC133176809 [Saccostrea echinata]|uniref:uncharacterized protein LOC133176809 n=1 Tax=Saccostrea echinata TaxID=191078 RepID=UPI002A8391BE|nr:uncharacterized protein LOC133176809 [Saccostrea echinata]